MANSLIFKGGEQIYALYPSLYAYEDSSLTTRVISDGIRSRLIKLESAPGLADIQSLASNHEY